MMDAFVSEKAKAIAFATILPGVCQAVGLYVWTSKKYAVGEFFKKSVQPTWQTLGLASFGLSDMATTAIAGYASYITLAKGLSSCDVTIAAFTFALAHAHHLLVWIPSWTSQRYDKMFFNSHLQYCIRVMCCAAFFNVNKFAGLISVPWVLFCQYGYMIDQALCELNPEYTATNAAADQQKK